MWEILASTGFDDLESEGKVSGAHSGTGTGGLVRFTKIVLGEELTGEEMGMKRIF
jgi:hypothetical protein